MQLIRMLPLLSVCLLLLVVVGSRGVAGLRKAGGEEETGAMRGNDDVICNRLGRDEGDIFSFLKCGIGDPVFIAREKVSYTRPVVLVSGFGGSALNARVLNHKAYPWYCKIFSLFSSSSSSKTSSSTSSSSKTFHLWFSIPELLAQRCVFADMALAFNETAQTFTPSATKDIVVTPNDFGGVQGKEEEK